MPIVSDEAQQLRGVEAALVKAFGERVSAELISAEVQAAANELCTDAKVRTFIPVLVQRRARERLRSVVLEPSDA